MFGKRIKGILFQHVLKPLIIRDLKLREKGKRPDRWYWADILALKWGFLGRYEKEISPYRKKKKKRTQFDEAMESIDVQAFERAANSEYLRMPFWGKFMKEGKKNGHK